MKIEVENVAAAAIEKIIDLPITFAHKVVEFFPRSVQWGWFELILKHHSVVGTSAPRVGKSMIIAFTILWLMLKHARQDVRIFSPRHEQAREAHSYIYNWVNGSPLLKAFVKRSAGGKMMLDQTKIVFQNGSNTKLFGINTRREGTNASIFWLNEFDWFPPDKLPLIFDRGMATNVGGTPTYYILDGTIEGIGNITNALASDEYFTLPMVDVYQGLAAGWLSEKEVRKARLSMTDDEWLRKYCLIPTEARNFIWESMLRFSQMVGNEWELTTFRELPAKTRYGRPPGSRIAFGLDMGAQGSGEDASEYALKVTEMVFRDGGGSYRRDLWGRTWSPTEDPGQIINDVADAWNFFRPDAAYGDSLDANLIAQINEEVHSRGYTDYDWRMFGDNSAGSWKQWRDYGLMAPLRNSGPAKHNMYVSLQKAIHNVKYMTEDDFTGNVMVFPQANPAAESAGELALLRTVRELANLGAEKTNAGYYKIYRIMTKTKDAKLQVNGKSMLGDDLPDALAMSNFALDFLETQEPKGDITPSVVTVER